MAVLNPPPYRVTNALLRHVSENSEYIVAGSLDYRGWDEVVADASGNIVRSGEDVMTRRLSWPNDTARDLILAAYGVERFGGSR